MGRRYRVRNHYVERDKKGRFKDWTNIGKSIHADARQSAKFKPSKTGYGHLGDYDKVARSTRGKRKSKIKKIKI